MDWYLVPNIISDYNFYKERVTACLRSENHNGFILELIKQRIKEPNPQSSPAGRPAGLVWHQWRTGRPDTAHYVPRVAVRDPGMRRPVLRPTRQLEV